MSGLNKKKYNINIFTHIIKYITLVVLLSVIFQFFTDRFLSRYELFWVVNYDDLLVNLFTAQTTIIILPLSLFGIFTEITNEVYLGQSIAEYMYMYRNDHFFAFNYKELTISSMVLTLVEYILMSKGLLAAELTTLVLNTTVMLFSLFSWFEVRIRKEKLYTFIQEQLYDKLMTCTMPEANGTYKKEKNLIKLLSNLKDWVVNGGDYELVEAIQFYENIYQTIGYWEIVIHAGNTEKEKITSELSSSYKDANAFFNELVTDLLRKQDYYRALRCSKSMLEIIALNRSETYYHPDHYHYRILPNLFRKISEMEMELLGEDWFCEYLITILKNGNFKGLFAQIEKTGNPQKLHSVLEESYILVCELLMAVWQNDNFRPKYKQKQLKTFLFKAMWDSDIENSALCVKIILIGSKEQTIIDMIVENNWSGLDWNGLDYPTKDSFPLLDEYQKFQYKSMVLLLAYIYYLVVYTKSNITIPKLKKWALNKNIGLAKEINISEVLIECIWKCFDEIKAFLDRNHKLDENFRTEYYKVIYDIMLYSAMTNTMTNRHYSITVENNTYAYQQVIHHFKYITGSDKFLEAVIDRYKKYIDLFEMNDLITNQMINDQFYEFKKVILKYYMDSLKKSMTGFDKVAFWDDLKRKLKKKLEADQQFETNSSNVQNLNENIVEEVIDNQFYFISPHEKDYDADIIKKRLYTKILRRNADIEKTSTQEITQRYDVLSLDWKDEKLNDEEIEYFIEKKQELFCVKLHFIPMEIDHIDAMNFRTYAEAYEFVKSEYRKVVFQMKVKI